MIATIPLEDSGYLEPSWFIQKSVHRQPLWLFGAGHISRALAPLLSQLDYQVTVFDERQHWSQANAFPQEVTVLTQAYPEQAPSADSHILIMTHSHKLDYQLLTHFISQPLAFLGVIGSRSKSVRFHHRLERDGYDSNALTMPIGLNGMGKKPMEIAISICAQLLQLRQTQESRNTSSIRPKLRLLS